MAVETFHHPQLHHFLPLNIDLHLSTLIQVQLITRAYTYSYLENVDMRTSASGFASDAYTGK